jgi:hypothetical protein
VTTAEYVRGVLRALAGSSPEDRHSPTIVAGRPRSPLWPAVRKHFLNGKVCIACGRRDGLNAHHAQPYHLFPDRELDPTNLVALCEGPTSCHFLCGHGATGWREYVRDPFEAADRYARMLSVIRGDLV